MKLKKKERYKITNTIIHVNEIIIYIYIIEIKEVKFVT